MTVSTELSHEEYTGNGVTTDFDFRFRIFEAKHLVVSVADTDGTERILTNGTDYTLRGVGSYRGGKVILKMPLATGWKIGITRDLPVVQETDLRNQGKFFAEVHEDAFDYLTMLIQKSLGFLSLCLRKPSFISDHYDAKGNKISNLGKPVKDGDAVDLGTMKEHISAKDRRSLRVTDKDIPALPGTSVRRNKQLGFDNNGMPLLLDPAETGALGYVLMDSFEDGAVITSRYQALHWLHNGEYYRWDGDLPKSVPAGSTPDSTGGVGISAWVGVGDAGLRSELLRPAGTSMIGQCESVSSLRNIEPQQNDSRILVASHTSGHEIGGGWFYSVTDGSDYEDDNGCVIKTIGGAAWVRKVSGGIDATYYGLIPDDETKALTNSEAIVKAAEYAFKTGREVTLPGGIKYIDDCVINHPVTIKGQSTRWGASLVNRNEPADIIHVGSGYAFDFPANPRPQLPTDTAEVIDGIHLESLSIRGTPSGKGGWRVNDENTASLPNFSGRRNTSATNIQISGYYAGYGYRLYETYTNQMTNCVVWECAVPYFLSKAHATNHVSCVYENCSYGCIALSCYSNNHFGGTIEGIKPWSKMSEPSDYDNAGGRPSFLSNYAGVAMRTRGGTTLLSGVYIEANVINGHIENNGELIVRDCYVNDGAEFTDYSFIGSAGRLKFTNNRCDGNANKGWMVKGNNRCVYAEVYSNSFYSTTKPTTIPDISQVGIFDTYITSDSAVDSNMFTRNFMGIRAKNISPYPASTSNIPIITESEQTRIRISSIAYSISDRTVELYPLSKTGCVLIPQGGGFLTLSNNQDYINSGLELTVMINNTGSAEVSVNGRTGFKQFSAKAPAGKMMILKFISYDGFYYMI